MNVIISRTDDAFQMKALNGAGKEVVMDASEQAGGQGSGVSPMEMVLMAIGGCSSIDIIDILKKQKVRVADLRVSVKGDRSETVPKVFKKVEVSFEIDGDVPPSKALRAADLSMEKYCSVSQMISKTADISYKVLVNGEEIS